MRLRVKDNRDNKIELLYLKESLLWKNLPKNTKKVFDWKQIN